MKQKCSICENEFESLIPHLANKKSCREKLGESKFQELKEEARKSRVSKKNKKYSKTVEGRIARDSYNNSEKGKLTKEIYNQSRKGVTQDQYNSSEKGKARQRKYLNKLREHDYDKNKDYQLHRKRKQLERIAHFNPVRHVIEVLLDSVLEAVSSNKIVKKNRKMKKRKTSTKCFIKYQGRDLKLDSLKDCVVCKIVKTDHIMGVCHACNLYYYRRWEAAEWHEKKEIEREAGIEQKKIQKHQAKWTLMIESKMKILEQ